MGHDALLLGLICLDLVRVEAHDYATGPGSDVAAISTITSTGLGDLVSFFLVRAQPGCLSFIVVAFINEKAPHHGI